MCLRACVSGFLGAWARALACARAALLSQHAKHVCHILLQLVTFMASRYFSALSHKRAPFSEKKKLLNIKCMFCIFSISFI
jgi:hypothetical protein